MSRTKYVAHYEGHIVGSRTTADRTYTHAILARGHGKGPHIVAWCGRPDLAQKEARKWSGYGYATQVLPAVKVEKPA